MTTEDRDNLARHVLARREDMDWTQLDVHARGGPSNSTLTTIEGGSEVAQAPLSRTTLRKLDKGLGWERGSAKRVLAGGEPRVALDEDRRDAAWLREILPDMELDDATRERLRSALSESETA